MGAHATLDGGPGHRHHEEDAWVGILAGGLTLPEELAPAALAAALPDTPELMEARAMLRAGTCDVYGARHAYVVRSRIVPLGVVIGTPPGSLLRGVLDGAPDDFELLVLDGGIGHVRAALRAWRAARASMHARPAGSPPHDPPPRSLDIRVAAPPDAPSVRSLPEDWRLWATASVAFSVVWLNGRPASICEAVATTETWWEVGVGTLDRYRRRGLARAAYLALAPVMAARGLRPAWGVLDHNEASLAMARSLGFRPVSRLWVLTPPA